MGRSATANKESGGLREFMASAKGRFVGIVLALAMVAAGGYFIWQNLGPSEAAALSRDRTFIDSKTLKPFAYQIKAGDILPVPAPSGERTGFPAELCYWTKDGKPKKEPTAVLLNLHLGKTGPTFCPDCGRLVVGHNPQPEADSKPPPLESEYKPRGGDR